MRVDDVPLWLRPAFVGTTASIATLWHWGNRLVRATSAIAVSGEENLEGLGSYILCGWHNTIAPFLLAQPDLRGHVWVNHPAWFMRPVHLLLEKQGVRLVLGSKGEEGRRAVATVARELRNGARSAIWPDGPAGPPFVLKPGVLHMAYASGAAIVPMQVTATRALRLRRSWDSKRFPLPFGSVLLAFGPAIPAPTEDSKEAFDRVARELVEAMGDGGLASSEKRRHDRVG